MSSLGFGIGTSLRAGGKLTTAAVRAALEGLPYPATTEDIIAALAGLYRPTPPPSIYNTLGTAALIASDITGFAAAANDLIAEFETAVSALDARLAVME